MAYSSPSPPSNKIQENMLFYTYSFSSLYMFYNNKKDIVFLSKTMLF
ncbi:polysaccharide deacetylase [Bacillus sp. BB51/4]|nr:polysaccharide deacetylase [Bacillus sp. BB51/4]PHB69297.1 polysaccharide deacetylase [Bacillus wiedmannii]TCD33408.1 polysaccharide deacetylase [Bacillus wiedmannii]